MALEIDWSHDYCLSCDRQISASGHGAYCSQSCRLADLEHASCSSGSPRDAGASSWTSLQAGGLVSGFHLPPPLNFSNMSGKQSPSASFPSSRSPVSGTLPSNYPGPPHGHGNLLSQLYSSPSRSSLSSLHNSGQPLQEPGLLSDKVRSELRDYASSFDRVRDWKRRVTVV